uniref:Uncharacterized protein n=1 Tax=Glossina palpalis gambiensis TaxID=67801 RepID=A0A1B0ARQ9_9MUSC
MFIMLFDTYTFIDTIPGSGISACIMNATLKFKKMSLSPSRGIAKEGQNGKLSESKFVMLEEAKEQKNKQTTHISGHNMVTSLKKDSKLNPKNFNLHSNVKSKIPTKSTTLLVPSNALDKANTARPSSLSLKISNENESKVSLGPPDTGKVLKKNISKASFSSNNSGKATPRNHTARGHLPTGIRRRSASTMSGCSSHPFSKENSDVTLAPIPKIKSNSGDHENFALTPRERVNENNKLKAFENMEKRLNDIQSEFCQKLESLKLNSSDKLKGTYKFISVVRNDKCELLVNEEHMKKAPKALPAHSIGEFKERVRGTLSKCVQSVFDYYKDYHTLDEEGHGEIYEKLQNTTLKELNAYLDDLCDPNHEPANYSTDVQIVKMQRELQECNKSLKMADKKLSDAQKAYDDKVHDLEIEFKAKCQEDITTRDLQISELQKKEKALEKQNENLRNEKQVLEDELENNTTNVSNMTKKLSQLEFHLKGEKDILEEKAESLAKELNAAREQLDDVMKEKQDLELNAGQLLQEQQSDIEKLKNIIEQLGIEKGALEDQLAMLEKACDEKTENSTYPNMKRQLQESEDRVVELQDSLEANEKLKDINQNQSKEAQMEVAKLRQSEAEKRREIEKLKIELSKAQYNGVQLEEQVKRDQQLLDVRSKLINSLQTNEKDQRIHTEGLYAQVAEKNNIINELNNELRIKSEEFRNLFTTISAKQMELSNQEHMIKLLEESNDRSQMLRVKQEEKIGRMEEEIAHLKQTMMLDDFVWMLE